MIWIFLAAQLPFLAASQPETGLFGPDTALQLELKMDLKKVIRDVGEDRIYHPATLSYLDSSGNKVWIPLRVKTRGKTRRNPSTCSFPPIRLNFKRKDVEGTLFEGQDKIKLVTHCKPADSYQDILVKEYLLYRHYQLFTPKGLRARLARMKYIDGHNPDKSIVRLGFLIEHIDQAGSRCQAQEQEADLYHQDQCNQELLDQFTLFQFMIGNTDWSVSKGHNVELLVNREDGIIPIPYDFDYSGAVDAPYAVPDPSLDIRTVQERVFRGYCRPPGTYEEVIQIFQEKKSEIYQLYREQPELSPKEVDRILGYYDKFYDILDDPRKVKKQINRACTLLHQHRY